MGVASSSLKSEAKGSHSDLFLPEEILQREAFEEFQDKYGDSVDQLHRVFVEMTKDSDRMTQSEFSSALQKLKTLGFDVVDSPFQDRLFFLFDKTGLGYVDLSGFLQGMAVIMGGTLEEKMEMTFRAYDLDGNGYITHDELTKMFRDAWLVGIDELSHQEARDEDSVTADGDLVNFANVLAERFADRAFDALDTNHDQS